MTWDILNWTCCFIFIICLDLSASFSLVRRSSLVSKTLLLLELGEWDPKESIPPPETPPAKRICCSCHVKAMTSALLFLNGHYVHILSPKLELISLYKEKQEDMDVSLTFCLCPLGAMIFPGPLWPNQWAYFKPQGVIWKIWISSFHRYLLLYCGMSGLVTAHCQSWVLFDIFPKIWIFHIALKTNFWKLFFKLLSFEDDLMKICETNWKQSQISQIFICRKKLSKILSR